MKSLSTIAHKNRRAIEFVESVSDAHDNYYLFAGTANASEPINQTVYDTSVEPYRSMLFAKKIKPSDVCLMIARHDYESGKVYAKYTDKDPLLHEKPYYAIVNAQAYSHVFKVLDNNNGVPSTVMPNIADIGGDDDAYTTSDGYMWKYMYSVDFSKIDKFATSMYFPYVANNSVIGNATSGSIDTIEVLAGGNGYSNYLTGTFSASDGRLNGNGLLYAINSNGSSLPDFYNGCVIYITADPVGNSSGQYRTIVDYSVNATTKFIELDRPFDVQPQNGAQYTINPGINIVGDGTETVNAVAWAIVNAAANSIDSIQMLNRGRDYKYVDVSVRASNVVPIKLTANIRAIYSPSGGHGAKPDIELGATSVSIAPSFAFEDAGVLIGNCTYQKIGIVHNPTFSEAIIKFSNNVSEFAIGETVEIVNEYSMVTNAVGVNGNTLITVSGAQLSKQFAVGDRVVVSNTTHYQLTNVAAIVSNTEFHIADVLEPATGTVRVSKADVKSTARVISANSDHISVANISSAFVQTDAVIGKVSGSRGEIDYTVRSTAIKTFDTFIACDQYLGYVSSGTFQSGETVAQGNTASATLIGLSSNGSLMYVSNAVGVFSNSAPITGKQSSATFVFSNKYKSEINFGSGEVLYIETMSDPVSRATTRSETYKLIVQF